MILQSRSLVAPCPLSNHASFVQATASRRSVRRCSAWSSGCARSKRARPPPRPGPSRCSTSAASCCRASGWRGCSMPARPGSSCRRWPAGWSTTKTRSEACPAAASSPASAVIGGARCMVVVNDSGIDAGAIQRMGGDKLLRAQDIALENKLPFVQLVESAGANLLQYKVEGFVHGGRLFYNLARLSAAGIPVITRGARLVHRRRRLHAGAVRLRDHGARPRQGLPRRPAAAEGRDRRDRHRRGARRRGDAHRASRAWASTWPRTMPTRCASRANC